MTTTPLLNEPSPPVSNDQFNATIIRDMWQEGQDLKKDLDHADRQFIVMKQERDALWHKCKKLEEQVAYLNERVDVMEKMFYESE